MSKIRRKHLESYLYGIAKGNLTTDLIIEPDDWSKYYLNPNGVNRTITFDATSAPYPFRKGDIYHIHNIGTVGNTLTVSNTSPVTVIHNYERYEFVFDGLVWSSYAVVNNQSDISNCMFFSRFGNTTDQYLDVHSGIPSNLVGFIMPQDGIITKLSVCNQGISTYSIGVYEKTRGLLTSISLINNSSGYINLTTPVPFYIGEEIIAKSQSGGSCKHPVSTVWYSFSI